MKKFLLNIIFALVMLSGVVLMLYPAISNWWNLQHQNEVITNYVQHVDEIPEEDYSDILNKAQSYNSELYGNKFVMQTYDEAHSEYESLLNPLGTGVMGHLNIPKIGVDLPIYHDTNENVLGVAIGHLFGSSLPVGGESTHACLSGHSGNPRAKLLTGLDELVEGDIFNLSVLNETLYYEVDQIKIVLPDDVDDIQIYEGEDYVTLITCYPYGVNSHRLIVRGHRVFIDSSDERVEPKGLVQTARSDGMDLFALCLSVFAGCALFLVVVYVILNRRR